MSFKCHCHFFLHFGAGVQFRLSVDVMNCTVWTRLSLLSILPLEEKGQFGVLVCSIGSWID